MHAQHVMMIFSGVLVAGISSAAQAAPLPDGTLLTIEPGTQSSIYGPCTSGSCFEFDYTLQLLIYPYSIAPGTDGGIIIGKN